MNFWPDDPQDPSKKVKVKVKVKVNRLRTSQRCLIRNYRISTYFSCIDVNCLSREDAVDQLSRFKRQVDELTMRNEDLQRSLTKTKQKLAGSEEQLRKLETKVSTSDINIANQVLLMMTDDITISANLFL